jgi:hypothetical protein
MELNMRQNGLMKASAAPAHHRLLGMTCISSIDGTVPMLAATGAFANPATSAALGLTVVAGIGAWITAWQTHPERLVRADWFRLAIYAAITMAVTMAGAALGALLAGDLVVLPWAAGTVVGLIAMQIAGIKLPSLGKAQLPMLVVGLGAILEAILWIP